MPKHLDRRARAYKEPLAGQAQFLGEGHVLSDAAVKVGYCNVRAIVVSEMGFCHIWLNGDTGSPWLLDSHKDASARKSS